MRIQLSLKPSLIVLKYKCITKFVQYNYLEIYSPGCFCNPVCIVHLCVLNTSFHCCICRHEVYLFAQFGKLLARIIFFGANVSVVNIRQKSYCRVARVFDEFIVRFVVYIQGVTVSYRFLSGNFQGIFNRPCFYYRTVQMELCRFLRPNFSMNCKDLRHADLVKGVL